MTSRFKYSLCLEALPVPGRRCAYFIVIIVLCLLLYVPVSPQGQAMLKRLVKGFRYLNQAIQLAPDVWAAMMIRMTLKPEVHRFLLDIVSTLLLRSGDKIPQTLWLCISKCLHESVNKETR